MWVGYPQPCYTLQSLYMQPTRFLQVLVYTDVPVRFANSKIISMMGLALHPHFF